MKVFLIRHGETTGDVEDRYGGWHDDHLTQRGLEQVGATVQKLIGREIEIIFSSPLIRAKETAEAIQSTIGVPVEYSDGFKERNYGILTGLTKKEALQTYPDVVMRHQDHRNTDPEGEGYEDFCARVVEALNIIVSRGYKTIGIVTHGGPIKCILRYLGKDVPETIGDGDVIELDRI
jgi:probable phosphoglycerate mutase